jgi:heme exporter protein A
MTAPRIPLLEASALCFHRQDEPIFGPVDVALHAGDVVLVEGDNGSGKTTLMRVLAGALRPSRGRVVHHEGMPPLLLGHHLALKGDLSARENLAVSAALYGQAAGTSIDDALDGAGLAGYEDEPVRRLSAGQKKRAALARLLLLRPRTWLLDEPYANLDRDGLDLVNRLLSVHAERGGAALVTSHGAITFAGSHLRRIRLHA